MHSSVEVTIISHSCTYHGGIAPGIASKRVRACAALLCDLSLCAWRISE